MKLLTNLFPQKQAYSFIKKILLFTLLIFITSKITAQTSVIKLTESNDNKQLKMSWRNTIAVGRAYNLLRADALEHLTFAQKEMGYKYCRFHAIFDDDMGVVKRKADGTLAFQWYQVDRVYDALLAIGIKPFVELNPMPQALASGNQTLFGYKMNVTPPKSYDEWSQLVDAFAKHLIERYGVNEVRTWYFEVWNEPNLKGFWSGTQEDYWKLYSASAFALKKVDRKLRVGGPASSTTEWIEDIINYTTKNKVPLDFLSTHLYPQDEQKEFPDRKGSPYKLGEYFSAKVKEVERKVKKSARPDLEIHWTEWNSLTAKNNASVSWTANSSVDNLYSASLVVRNAIELDSTVKSLTYWVVSDVFDEVAIPQFPFSNGYGMLTIHGIPKASYNAFKLLRKMTGNLMNISSQNLPLGTGVRAVSDNGTVRILLWNQNFLELDQHTNWKSSVQLPSSLNSEKLKATKVKIGIGQGSPWETWKLLGSPKVLSPTQLQLLKAHSEPSYSLAEIVTTGNTKSINFDLKPGEVQYIEISAIGEVVDQKTVVDSKDLDTWEKAMSDKL